MNFAAARPRKTADSVCGALGAFRKTGQLNTLQPVQTNIFLATVIPSPAVVAQQRTARISLCRVAFGANIFNDFSALLPHFGKEIFKLLGTNEIHLVPTTDLSTSSLL